MTGRILLAWELGKLVVDRLAPATAADPAGHRRRVRVDRDWRRLPDGYAARLDERTTIDVARPVGRWRAIDPRRPEDCWRSLTRTVALGAWAGVVGTAWWLGSSRGRGPLRSVQGWRDIGHGLGGPPTDAP